MDLEARLFHQLLFHGVKNEHGNLSQHGREVVGIHVKNGNLSINRQSPPADEDHVIWSKAPEQLVNGP